MGFAAARGQNDLVQEVFFKMTDTTGTPSITEVHPSTMTNNISVADTAQGRATVTIKNFKGKQGAAQVFANPQTTSLMTAIVSKSYSNDDLSFELSTEDDGSTLTDASICVHVVAY